MTQKDKLHFKYPKIRKQSGDMEFKRYSVEQQRSNVYSDQFLRNLDSVCERLDVNMKAQNMKIENLENKYLEALLGRFDKLILVNQKIGKNLEKLVERFGIDEEIEEKPTRSEYLLPPLQHQSKANSIGFKALSTRRLLKSTTEQRTSQTLRKMQSSGSQLKLLQKQSRQSKSEIGQPQNVVAINEKQVVDAYQLQYRSINRQPSMDSDKYLKDTFQKIIEAQCSEQSVSVSLNKFVGHFFNKKTEFYYSQYISGKIRFDDLKIRFSSDIINQAIQLSKKWMDFVLSKKCQNALEKCQIKGKDFFRLFNDSSKKSLQYLIHKYPPSRTKQIDTQLSERIKEIKSFSIVKYDLLRNAGVEFGQKKGQTDFSTEVKQWLNILIGETKKQYPMFKQKMKDIFSNNEGSLDGSKLDNQVEYQIGSKIPENTPIYTQQQIDLPGLPIKNPQILRILIKWFEQLYSYFTNTKEKILENKHGFKSNRFKGVPIRLPHSKLEKLVEKLENIHNSKLKPFKKGIFRNLGELLEGLIATSLAGIEGYDFLDQREVTITKLASVLYETFKQYILIFLNGIMSFLVDLKNPNDSSAAESIISLITFTLMDLLRCKCVGTKKQIYRIYNQILEKKDYFEVIRVKNKLNEPTRDILINLKLKNSFLVCQVQLSLGSNQQQANDHFCHFLYELERSQFGTIFQCASQIANLDPKVSYIKKHKDLRFKKFSCISELLKTKIQIRDGNFYCSVSHGQTKMQLVPNTTPFCCIYCNSFIQSNRLRLPYFKCFRCAVCICTQCVGYFSTVHPNIMATVFENTDCTKKCIPDQFYKKDFVYNGSYQENKIKEDIKKVLQTNEYAVLCIVNKAGCHQVIFKKYKNTITEAFSTVKDIPILNIDRQQKTSLSCIVTLQPAVKKNVKELEGYMKYHISLDWQELDEILQNNNIEEVICIANEKLKSILIIDKVETEGMIDHIRLEKRLGRTIKKLNKNKDSYFELTSKNIDNLDFLNQIQNKKNITALNLWQNKITNIDILSNFINLQQLYLQENIISSITPLLTLNKIQVLGLSQNNVSGMLPKLVMPNLQCLILSNNKISDISNLSTSMTPNLAFIKMYKNPLLTTIPELEFPKLEVILLNDCGIKNVSGLSRSRLPSLTNLDLSNNQIEGILTDLNFPQLTNLDISKNKISSLSIFIKSRLPKLRSLDLRYNQISDSISDLNLPSLRQLLLANNRITYVGEQILYCKKLPLINTIDLRYNNISGKLPRFKLKTLKKLDFGYNKLSDISQLQQTLFYSIQQIRLDHNQIQCKLPCISFKTLKSVDLSYNFISDVNALSRWSGHSIQDIKLNNNKITCDIPRVEMYSLKYLNFANNHIKDEQILENIHLTPSIIKINMADNSPMLMDVIRKKSSRDEVIQKTVEI